MSYRDIQIREGAHGPEIVCVPDAESGMQPVLPLTADDYALLGRRIAERAAARRATAGQRAPGGERDPQVTRLQRIIELLCEYGEAKFGDEWWPGNAAPWIFGKGQELAALLETPGLLDPGGEIDARVIAAADVALRQAEVARRGAELDYVPVGKSFLARSAGRLFRISSQRPFGARGDWWSPVDCRDMLTGMESQAIVRASLLRSRAVLLGAQPVRDAVKSAYLNATAWESGDYPAGGTLLPDDFVIEVSNGPV